MGFVIVFVACLLLKVIIVNPCASLSLIYLFLICPGNTKPTPSISDSTAKEKQLSQMYTLRKLLLDTGFTENSIMNCLLNGKENQSWEEAMTWVCDKIYDSFGEFYNCHSLSAQIAYLSIFLLPFRNPSLLFSFSYGEMHRQKN